MTNELRDTQMEIAKIRKQEFHGVICREERGKYVYYMQRGADHPWTEEKIRTSTRRYGMAYFYSEPVTSGNKSGLSLYFSFGKKPLPGTDSILVEQYAIA